MLQRVSETELAYLAGILDGEGTFTVYKTTAAYSALIAVASTSRELIDWLVVRFGGSISETPAPAGNRSASWQWQLREKAYIVALLPTVIPFLLIKRLHAQLFLKYCLEIQYSRRGRRISSEDAELRNAYCTIFADLNAVGKEASAKKAKVVQLLNSGGITLP